jgi:hypothetical protein
MLAVFVASKHDPVSIKAEGFCLILISDFGLGIGSIVFKAPV